MTVEGLGSFLIKFDATWKDYGELSIQVCLPFE